MQPSHGLPDEPLGSFPTPVALSLAPLPVSSTVTSPREVAKVGEETLGGGSVLGCVLGDPLAAGLAQSSGTVAGWVGAAVRPGPVEPTIFSLYLAASPLLGRISVAPSPPP